MDHLANVKASASRIGETPAFPLFEWRAKRTGHGEPQDVEYPSGGGCGQQRPNPVVPQKPVRRRFDAEYKARILREADQFTKPRQRGALLRREGLYSSHLSVWRKQCGDAALAGLVPKRRRRKTNPNAPLVAENQRLVRENARLMKRLRQTEAVRNVPKKLSEILGLQLPPNDYVTEPRKRLRNLRPPWAAVACEAIAVPRPASPRGFECRRMEARSGCLSRRVVCRQGSR